LFDLDPIVSIACDDGEEFICGGTEDGDVVWLALSFAKQVASTANSVVSHQDSPISCCRYFSSAPLVATADAESNVIFWSVAPLRSYEFFCKLKVSQDAPAGGDSGKTNSNTGNQAVAITSMTFSWPDEELMIIGTEVGSLVCVNISEILHGAQKQRDDILYRKTHSEAADVISGKIFESMPKPDDSDTYCHSLENAWIVKRAHRGSIDALYFCQLHKPVIITRGFDVRVCLWDPETGTVFGTLEQGLPEGIVYNRQSEYNFPIDAHEQVRLELEQLCEAAKPEEDEDEDGSGDGSNSEEASEGGSQAMSKAGSEAGGSRRASGAEQRKLSKGGQSAPNLRGAKAVRTPGGITVDFSATKSRYLTIPQHKIINKDHDWFSGPLASNYATAQTVLPQLQSGIMRPPMKQQRQQVVSAALRLSSALGNLGSSRSSLAF